MQWSVRKHPGSLEAGYHSELRRSEAGEGEVCAASGDGDTPMWLPVGKPVEMSKRRESSLLS